MQHGHMYHGVHIYEEAVRVPLIFRFPGRIQQGAVFNAPVELVDLMPTIFDLINIKPENTSFQGRSLAAALCGEAKLEPNRPIYLHRRHYSSEKVENIWVKGEKFAIRHGKWKYIEGKEEYTKEIFDIENDPG